MSFLKCLLISFDGMPFKQDKDCSQTGSSFFLLHLLTVDLSSHCVPWAVLVLPGAGRRKLLGCLCSVSSWNRNPWYRVEEEQWVRDIKAWGVTGHITFPPSCLHVSSSIKWRCGDESLLIQWGFGPRLPRGCLKVWLVLNTVHTIFFS